MPEFAPRDEIGRREESLETFITQVLRLPWAFVSDGTRLADFGGVRTELELSEACLEVYGVGLEPRHFEMPLWRLLDELGEGR